MSVSKFFFSLFFLLVLFVQPTEAKTFWIVTKVTNLEFNNACLAKSCFLNGLRFRVVHSISDLDEFSLIEWPSQKFISEKIFTSFWNSGEPSHVETQLEVINYDPTYHFPRVCDSSPKTLLMNAQTNASKEYQLYELRGNCFNVTLEVSKHEERCPWCPEPVIISESQTTANNEALWDKLSDPLYFWPIAIATFLSLIVFFLVIILVCVLASQGSSTASITSSNNRLIDNSLSSGSGTYIHPVPSYKHHMIPQCPLPQKPMSIESYSDH
uniref:Uncharacterized protein n=1 Tax=Panagrolaimus sp. ES5 TaxID=591445 RepID=A0AC34GDC1_9BILA